MILNFRAKRVLAYWACNKNIRLSQLPELSSVGWRWRGLPPHRTIKRTARVLFFISKYLDFTSRANEIRCFSRISFKMIHCITSTNFNVKNLGTCYWSISFKTYVWKVPCFDIPSIRIIPFYGYTDLSEYPNFPIKNDRCN